MVRQKFINKFFFDKFYLSYIILFYINQDLKIKIFMKLITSKFFNQKLIKVNYLEFYYNPQIFNKKLLQIVIDLI